MGEKIVVGPPINRGLRTDVTPFVIDNDSFPTLINAYQWRGRVKRKRGTTLLGRLQRYLGTTDGSGNLTVTIIPAPIATGISSFMVGTDIFTDQGGSSPVMMITNSAGSGELNRNTGSSPPTAVLTIMGSQKNTPVIYFPSLPVMGLEDLALTSSQIPTSAQYPGTLAFDTDYSYNIPTNTFPYTPYDVSFYKNPPTGTYPGYVQKGNPSFVPTPLNWNGKDYQQFWTTNYEGALWATNGIATSPISLSTISMQFKPIVAVTVTSGGPPAIVNLQITGHGLVRGDFLFINEVVTTTGINFQTGYVTAVVDANNVTVEFPNATIASNGTGGIAQYLTNTAISGKDCLRWYDGDPTNGLTPPTYNTGLGWVNFSPPINQFTAFPNFSIAQQIPGQYYLVGARLIYPFKDRILFFGPVIQTSIGSPIYLQDTIIFSQNGTPYYTCSYTNTPNSAVDNPTSATNSFTPILVPSGQTATSPAYFEDYTGFGGFISAGLSTPILTVGNNEDVLIVGFSSVQTKLVYTQNDAAGPFDFFLTNAELGSSSTFSSVIMDKGVIVKGNRGYLIADQTGARRIDLEVIDLVFETSLLNNGTERFCAQRDYINEWIYFTYPSNKSSYVYPNQTLLYNYRDDSWAIFNENYTTYGQFRPSTGLTWNNAPIWQNWTDPWDSGSNTILQPQVIAGNQQGFILFRETESTGEDTSLYIQNISTNTITCPNHCLNVGNFILIDGCLGSVGASVNGKIFQVLTTTPPNTFTISPTSGTYLGGGLITRMYVPYIQTKQFPVAWGLARKTRLGPQQYLLTKTPQGQIQLLIFLSQNATYAYNVADNDSLIYSTVLYTCPESINLGLTAANINLQMVTGSSQGQIFHRMNTSLLGDTVQIGFTMSYDQMAQFSATQTTYTITGATQAYPCVLTAANALSAGNIVQISGVQGMTQLNNVITAPNPVYQVISATSTTVTINVDSSAFSTYTSGGTITLMEMPNQFEEIELHSFVLDVNPSQLLA